MVETSIFEDVDKDQVVIMKERLQKFYEARGRKPKGEIERQKIKEKIRKKIAKLSPSKKRILLAKLIAKKGLKTKALPKQTVRFTPTERINILRKSEIQKSTFFNGEKEKKESYLGRYKF